MPLADWLHQYPGVQRPDDVLDGVSVEKESSPQPSGLYLLRGHTPLAIASVPCWARWMSGADRQVAYTQRGTMAVSTVFLGLAQHVCPEGPPLLFASMAVRGDDDSPMLCWYYATWSEADAGHADMVALLQAWEVQRGDNERIRW